MNDFIKTRQIYEERGFACRVGLGIRPAILVIDLTRGFTDPRSPLGADLTDVIGETVRLLNEARALGLPVIYTSVAYHNPEMEGGHWVRKIPSLAMLRFGTDAVEIDPRLGRLPSEPVVYKCFTSAFAGTHLRSMLQFLGVDTLILCGTSTSGCIRATAADAVQLGYRCIVPETAVGDRAEGPHRANLFDIDAKYGDVMPMEAVLAGLPALGERDGGSTRRP